MRQVYKVAHYVRFTYETNPFFKFNKKQKEGYIIRNTKYIYAKSEDAAKKKYKEHFWNECKTIGEACYLSEYFEDFDPLEWRIDSHNEKFLESKIIVFLNNKAPTIEEYKKYMLADDFRDWWWDGHEQKTKKESRI